MANKIHEKKLLIVVKDKLNQDPTDQTQRKQMDSSLNSIIAKSVFWL